MALVVGLGHAVSFEKTEAFSANFDDWRSTECSIEFRKRAAYLLATAFEVRLSENVRFLGKTVLFSRRAQRISQSLVPSHFNIGLSNPSVIDLAYFRYVERIQELNAMAAKQKNRGGRPPVLEITEKQRQTLRMIRDFLGRTGQPPTIQELADALDLTPATVFASVKQLIKKGYLKRDSGKHRGLSIAKEPTSEIAEQISIPVLGQVAAGALNFAEENTTGWVTIDAYLAAGGRCFGLRVMGESMINAGIEDGDTIAVRSQPLAENGDIVVACLGNEATVKRLHYARDRIELRPENPDFDPIVIGPDDADQFRILGRVVAQIRQQRL